MAVHSGLSESLTLFDSASIVRIVELLDRGVATRMIHQQPPMTYRLADAASV
jgi:hypothetical protein